MRLLSMLILMFVAIAPGSLMPTSAAEAIEPLAFEHVTVIDGTGRVTLVPGPAADFQQQANCIGNAAAGHIDERNAFSGHGIIFCIQIDLVTASLTVMR